MKGDQRSKDRIAGAMKGQGKDSPLEALLGKEPLKKIVGQRPITSTVKFLLNIGSKK
jgi:hypothetical protein